MEKEYTTVNARYSGNWNNVKDDCMLCEMDKVTDWYLETPNWVVAEKLGGGPFVVLKRHREYLTPPEKERMEHVVGLVYDDFSIRVLMNVVEDHWHGHIVTDCEPKVSPR